jgi:hypothetical protein
MNGFDATKLRAAIAKARAKRASQGLSSWF